MQQLGSFFQPCHRMDPIHARLPGTQDSRAITQMGNKVAADQTDLFTIDPEGDELAGIPAVAGTDMVEVAHWEQIPGEWK
jgi:hypothetical protein